MAVFKCKMCGGQLEIGEGETVVTCEFCGTRQTLPRLADEKKANLIDRANHFRRNNDFDKAMGIYEQILNEDTEDAESYWSIVLCRYGIEYVEDPVSHKRVPTVNRAQFTSVFDDEDYKSAITYADAVQKGIYEAEAVAINEIQKGILAISGQEEPFDIFICYKETDHNGRRTPDSVLATELYHELTKEGFKVFFSRITLEDKLGTAYEPYIFAALHSAKVMVVLGTKPEYFNAVWVKNEWARYLALIKNGGNKILIPAYRDMDPYDLPEEFSHLQAQDMGKLGFMQDLVRGIQKIVSIESLSAVKETVIVQNTATNASALVKRGYLALEDGEWDKADDFFEQALNQDAEDAQAYLGKLLADLRVSVQEDLKNCEEPFDDSNNYQKVIRFGSEKLKRELEGYVSYIKERNEDARKDAIYYGAQKAMDENTIYGYKKAVRLLETIISHKDSVALKETCFKRIKELNEETERLLKEKKEKETQERIEREKQAEALRKQREEHIEELRRQRELKKAKQIQKIKKYSAIAMAVVCVVFVVTFLLTKVIIPEIRYSHGVSLRNRGEYRQAIAVFQTLEGYKDSSDQIKKCVGSLIEDYNESQKRLLSCGYGHTVGLKADGTVVAAGYNGGKQCNVSGWKDIVTVSTGNNHTVGLKSDGTVVACGENSYGQCGVNLWTDIVSISAGKTHTLGLKPDGTVVVTEYRGFDVNYMGQCDVSGWRDIVAIAAGETHSVGLKSDGTVVAVGNNASGQCNVQSWRDIVAISAGETHSVGLKSDGSVVAIGNNASGQCNVYNWKDIVSISAGGDHTVGLKSDGTVVAVGSNGDGQCNVADWQNIIAIAAGEYHTIGLKTDGTVVAVGNNAFHECNTDSWNLFE